MKRKMNYILSVVSVIITFLFVEIGFRIVAYHNDLKTLESIQAETPLALEGKAVTLGQMIRLSQNPRIIYELIPDLSVHFVNQPVSINSLGFRGEQIPIEKKTRTIRIVGIGDSVMFGQGVKDHETYLALLNHKLNEDSRGFLWEIINTAVPGYNTVMEVETLKEKGLRYQPDIVIIDYVGNDTDLPNFISERENYLALNQSFTVKYFGSRRLRSIQLIGAPPHSQEKRFENNPCNVPPQYKEMVGADAVRYAMQELSSLSQKQRFEVIVLSHLLLPEWVKEISSTLKFHIVETTPEWEKYAAAQKFIEPESVRRLNKDDPHPSVIGHQIICNTLFKYIEESGLLRK